jgi:hypothetical protein
MCSTCDPTCSTCFGLATYCTSCKGNRLESPLPINKEYLLCTCPDGFYEDNKSTNCPACDFKCTTCS